jgi:site-specific DNA-methyltransferase (adenine-specific)
MTPYYSDGLVQLYHGDCQELLPSLLTDCAVVSDPPYGMDWDTDTTRFSGGNNSARRSSGRNDRRAIVGDAVPFDPAPLATYPECVLWGFNHFPTLPAGGALVWIKRHDAAFGSFLSDAEIAWVKGRRGVFCRRDMSMNAITQQRAHPTQKPVSLFTWCLGFVSASRTVLDPYAGSGTTLVAAKALGRQAIGIEIDERYCSLAAERCRQEVLDFGGAA